MCLFWVLIKIITCSNEVPLNKVRMNISALGSDTACLLPDVLAGNAVMLNVTCFVYGHSL